MKNTIKTALILIGLSFPFFIVGYISLKEILPLGRVEASLPIGGVKLDVIGLVSALIFTAFLNIGIYLFSDKIILRWNHAREVKEVQSGICTVFSLEKERVLTLHAILRNLTKKANLPRPKLHVIASPMPNIFSTGRNKKNASIVVTNALLKLLDQEELESVVGHELFHVKNKDTLISTIIAVLTGILTGLATLALWCSIFLGFGQEDEPAPKLIRFFTMSLFAPPSALLIQLFIPKSREYAADKYSASLCMKPHNLARALEKIENQLKLKEWKINPSHSHLFIINPLRFQNNENIFNSWFNTHPSTKDRVKNLNTMGELVG
ncbi:MAG: M48 family metalloprotease [Methanosarcinales archaeon]